MLLFKLRHSHGPFSHSHSKNMSLAALGPTQTFPTLSVFIYATNHTLNVVISELFAGIDDLVCEKGNVIDLPVATVRYDSVGREIRTAGVVNEAGDATKPLGVNGMVFSTRNVKFVESEEIRRAVFVVDLGATRGFPGPDHFAKVLVYQDPPGKFLGTAETFWGGERKEN